MTEQARRITALLLLASLFVGDARLWALAPQPGSLDVTQRATAPLVVRVTQKLAVVFRRAERRVSIVLRRAKRAVKAILATHGDPLVRSLLLLPSQSRLPPPLAH